NAVDAEALRGNAAEGGGASKTCRCPSGGASIGGRGGTQSAGATSGPTDPEKAWSPNPGKTFLFCAAGKDGAPGAPGSGGAAATEIGTLKDPSVFVEAGGMAGASGEPGQGGGGGSASASSVSPPERGGGGGCGSCG